MATKLLQAFFLALPPILGVAAGVSAQTLEPFGELIAEAEPIWVGQTVSGDLDYNPFSIFSENPPPPSSDYYRFNGYAGEPISLLASSDILELTDIEVGDGAQEEWTPTGQAAFDGVHKSQPTGCKAQGLAEISGRPSC